MKSLWHSKSLTERMLQMSARDRFKNEFLRCVEHLDSQSETLKTISELIFKSLNEEGILHVFGSGHSHVIAEELFHRAGGLVQVNAILEDYLMPHKGPSRVGTLERSSGIAAGIVKAHSLQAGEIMILASNSGINAVTVELAELAKEKGLTTIAFTSLTHSKNVPSRGNSKKLFEVVDYIVDSGSPRGDACVGFEGMDLKVSPLSGVLSLYFAQTLVADVVERFREAGITPPVYQSANTPGGDEHNKVLEAKYKARIQHLL